jgi:hypothetical protein
MWKSVCVFLLKEQDRRRAISNYRNNPAYNTEINKGKEE